MSLTWCLSPAAATATSSHALLVDPLLQTGDWAIPDSTAIETALLPGVTDASAQAVALAAETIGSPVAAVATGTRYEVHGDVDDDTMSVLAKRLLANQVIERWSIGPIEPTFVDSEATADIGCRARRARRTRRRGAGGAQPRARPLARPRRAACHRRSLPRCRSRADRRRVGDAGPDVERALRPQDVPGPDHRRRRSGDHSAAAATARRDNRHRRSVPAQCVRRQRRHRLVLRRHDHRRQGGDAQPSVGDRALRRSEHRRRWRDPRRDGRCAPPDRRHRHLVLRSHRSRGRPGSRRRAAPATDRGRRRRRRRRLRQQDRPADRSPARCCTTPATSPTRWCTAAASASPTTLPR